MTKLEIAVNELLDEGQSFQDVQNEFNCIITRRVWTDKQRTNAAQREFEAVQNAEAERVAAETQAHVDSLRAQLRDQR
ncbi:MAG: hypothetical protein WA182_21700 [Candidatus Sulfotelmatobacter sp.]